MKNKIYLDNAATTKPLVEVVDYAIELMKDFWQNPNSVYEDGLNARNIIEDAREIIAKKINASSEEIIFCPTASCANNLAILGYLRKNICGGFVTSTLEHDSIRKINIPGYVAKTYVDCDEYGIVDPNCLNNYQHCLISIIGANNEIGTIQDIAAMSKIAHANNCVFHSDLTQYIPYINVDVKDLGLDMATFSSHKLGGLRGCAVLYVKNGIELEPLVYGHQEKGLVAGTENVVAIGAMGRAIELLDYNKSNYLYNLRGYLLEKLTSLGVNYHINTYLIHSIPNNLNICFPDMQIDSQQLIALLDLENIQVSAGSACNSGDKVPSHVLKAIGLSDEHANKSIRISLNSQNTMCDVDDFIECLSNILNIY